jgi:hypothetical protein
LQAINDEDDILMAMARELVTEKGIGERADAVWAALQKKQEGVFAVGPSEVESTAAQPEQELKPIQETPMVPTGQLIPVIAPRHENSRRERVLESQLKLF